MELNLTRDQLDLSIGSRQKLSQITTEQTLHGVRIC